MAGWALIAVLACAAALQAQQVGTATTPPDDDVSSYLAEVREPALERQSLDALYQSALVRLNNGLYDEAESDFRRLYAREPSQSRGIEGVARVYLKQGRIDDAVQLMRRESERMPGRRDILMALVRIASDTHAYSVGIEALSAALKAGANRPADSIELYLAMAEVFRAQGDRNSALIALAAANRIMPRDISVALALGEALEAQDRASEAAQVYNVALGFDVSDPAELAKCIERNSSPYGDLDLRLACAQFAHRREPNSLAVADTLGLLYVMKNPTRAVEIYEPLADSSGVTPTYLLHFALALSQSGDRVHAQIQLERALGLNPTAAEAESIRQLQAVLDAQKKGAQK